MITFLLAALTAAPTTLEADPNHSTVTFAVKHMMVTTVRGNFTKSSSALTYDPDDPTKAVVEVKIDPASVNTNNEKRDGHLKTPDSLYSTRGPAITFKSTKVEYAGTR